MIAEDGGVGSSKLETKVGEAGRGSRVVGEEEKKAEVGVAVAVDDADAEQKLSLPLYSPNVVARGNIPGRIVPLPNNLLVSTIGLAAPTTSFPSSASYAERRFGVEYLSPKRGRREAVGPFPVGGDRIVA